MDNTIEKYDYIKFMVVDIHGISRGKFVSINTAKKLLTEGTGLWCAMCVSSLGGDLVHYELPGLKALKDGNSLLVPDLSTLRSAPVSPPHVNIGVVYGELIDSRPGAEVVENICPRSVARRQLEKLNDLGYELFLSMELECNMFDAKTKKPLFDNTNYMFSDTGLVMNQDVIVDILETAKKCKLNTELCHMEYSAGQFELILVPDLGLKAVDDILVFREVIKQVARKRDIHATFMTYPQDAVVGNGCHFNHSLRRVSNHEPVFYDSKTSDKLSATCKHWIAGILKHLPALTALLCPTVNCYRRLTKLVSPTKNDWDIENRMMSTRVKNSSPSGCYVESRLPSSAANPYIITAAIVSAGLDGLRKELPCPPVRTATDQLPMTLEASLELLEKDEAIIEALGPDFVKIFCCVKRSEIKQFSNTSDISDTSPERLEREKHMYMDML